MMPVRMQDIGEGYAAWDAWHAARTQRVLTAYAEAQEARARRWVARGRLMVGLIRAASARARDRRPAGAPSRSPSGGP